MTASKLENTKIFIHFENMNCTINIGKITVTFFIIQRPHLENKMTSETH